MQEGPDRSGPFAWRLFSESFFQARHVGGAFGDAERRALEVGAEGFRAASQAFARKLSEMA